MTRTSNATKKKVLQKGFLRATFDDHPHLKTLQELAERYRGNPMMTEFKFMLASAELVAEIATEWELVKDDKEVLWKAPSDKPSAGVQPNGEGGALAQAELPSKVSNDSHKKKLEQNIIISYLPFKKGWYGNVKGFGVVWQKYKRLNEQQASNWEQHGVLGERNEGQLKKGAHAWLAWMKQQVSYEEGKRVGRR